MTQKQEATQAQRKKLTATSTRLNAEDNSHYAVTICAPVREVFAFFRDLSHLPLFMKDIKSVEQTTAKKSHWVVETKAGLTVEWDAEIVQERANEMISWRSLDGSEIETSGTIWFQAAPGTLGTVVSLSLDYKIPTGKFAELITMFTGDNPEELAFVNLRRLKAYLETGEIPTIEGQTSGRVPQAEKVTKH